MKSPKTPLLDYAAIWLKKRNLDAKIAKLREQQRALLNGHCSFTSSFCEDSSRADLTLDIPLAEYLKLFPDAEKESTLKEYETDHQYGNVEGAPLIPSVARYLRWPTKHVGTMAGALDGRPLHVWVQTYSQTTYTPKDKAAPLQVGASVLPLGAMPAEIEVAS